MKKIRLNEQQAMVRCAKCINGYPVSMAQEYPNPPGCVAPLYPLSNQGGPQDPCNPGSWTPPPTPPTPINALDNMAFATHEPSQGSNTVSLRKAKPNRKGKRIN